MKVPLIEFSYELSDFSNDLSSLLVNHVTNSQFIGGKSVSEFEENFSRFLNIEYVVSVGNGTDALLIGLEALELRKKEVIVPSFSFFATSEAIVKAGLVQVFVDINNQDCNIDVELIEENITENTGAILPVHLYGNASNMKEIKNLANKYNLKIVEDVAQSFGTKYNNKYLGTIGDIGCFSFFPTKTLGAYGDGGAIITNDENLATKARMLKNHGAKKKYFNELFGYNSRLDSIQASVLNFKLEKINEWIKRRIEIGNFYDLEFKSIEGIKLLNNKNSTFNYYTIFILNNKRDEFKSYLDQHEISNAIYYPKTLPSLPAHNINKKFPIAEKACKEIISLPIWPGMSEDQQNYVIKTVKNFF
jgi:dTDP-4-amino-4,6-dideoxygalactose transaminase